MHMDSYLNSALLGDLRGEGSYEKRLQPFVWALPADQKQRLLDVLVAGDGNDNRMYSTVSDSLLGDILRLYLELGITPYYSRHGSK